MRAKSRFDSGIQRIRNLDSVYTHLVSNLHYPENDVSDILRSELVYVISSFDRFIHDVVKQGMVESFLGTRVATNAYKNFSISLEQVEAIKHANQTPPPETIFENAIRDNHKHLAFQDPKKVVEALSLIWLEEHKWQQIAICMSLTENDVRVELKNIIIRRNQIVHEGDIELLTGNIQPIIYTDTKRSVDFIESLVNCIFGLIS